MAILNIVKDGDEILRKKSKNVDKITPRIVRLVEDMKDTLIKAEGAGLAAVQVGVLRRIVIIDTGDEMFELINPEIIAAEGEQEDLEGCLSCPDMWGYTHRPMKVTVRAMNVRGEIVEHTGEGLTARAFCHELDHLEGVLFYDNAVKMLTPEELEALKSE